MGWTLCCGKNLDYLTIPERAAWGVTAAFSIRKGGVSKAPYASLNLGMHVNDDRAAVLNNRNRFLKELDCLPEDCVAANQVHGTKVILVEARHKGTGILGIGADVPEGDALLSLEKVGLLSFYADCVPLYFCCPPIGLVGLAHAGWKGTAANIVREVMRQVSLLGGAPRECYAAIGPCIGPCCYEIGEEVAHVFREKGLGFSVLEKPLAKRYVVDLALANRELLLREGILPENIVTADLCTACREDLFFSYRRDGGQTGRMASFIIRTGQEDKENH